MLTKTEILRKYRNELRVILDIEYNKDEFINIIEFIEHKEQLEFNLASSYLTKYPCLNDQNCSGRGLPKHTVEKYSKRYECYQCEEHTDWLAPDSRCGKCTRLTVEEVRGA